MVERLSPVTDELEVLAWRYELADAREWIDGRPANYTNWRWHVSESEPNAGEAMRNVTPLYAESPK